MIATKFGARRQELETQLSQLLKVDGNSTRRGRGKMRTVAVKYRNHADEDWSGRGRMPLWLGAEIKAGKIGKTFRSPRPKASNGLSAAAVSSSFRAQQFI
jgi:DNA-binding protein H-NS